MGFSAFNPVVCHTCSADMESCKTLHPYYFVGGIATIIGSLIVIISYILTPKLRYHPSILIFYRSIFDLALGISFTSLSYLNIENLACKDIGCDIMGNINLFLFLCSIGSYVALLFDLYQSIKNPFSLPKTQNIKMTNCIIILFALLISAIARFVYKYAYREDIQYCSLRQYSTASESFNPYSIIFLYTPLIIASLIAIFVTIVASMRLYKGLPHTFDIRKSSICNAWWYSIIITLYIVMVGSFYFAAWNETIKHNFIWYKLYAVTLPSFGVADCVVWIITNYAIICKPQNRDRTISSYQSIQRNQLKLKHPKQIFDDIQGDVKDGCGKKWCNRMGIAVVKDKQNGFAINEALRREVLAYTTDGISQSVDLVYKGAKLKDSHYPQNIKDYGKNVITKFRLQIEKNRALVGSTHQDQYNNNNNNRRTICKCCCIRSTQDTNNMLVPLRSIRADIGSVIEEDSDTLHTKQREFVDYAPMVFRYIRNEIMSINDEEYQESIIPLDSKEQLRVLRKCKIGDGKSGAFFFITHDSKYVVKTLEKSEVKFLLTILKDYVRYLMSNKYTILSRYVGLHSLKIYGLIKYFVVMENVFEGNLKPTEIYDLKGSWVGRSTNHELYSGSTMKDVDLKRPIIMEEYNRNNILNQLKNDSEFLAKHNIMDYSVLLGIYYLKIEFQDRIREENDSDASDQCLGGIRARIIDSPGIYYIGIIDTLQQYTLKKKMETWLKTYIKRLSNKGISSVEPIFYGKRFINYMRNVIISQNAYKLELRISDKPFATERVLIYASCGQNVDESMTQIIKQKSQFSGPIITDRMRAATDSKNQLIGNNRFACSAASFHNNLASNEEEKTGHILDIVEDSEEFRASDVQTTVSTNDSLTDPIDQNGYTDKHKSNLM